MLNEQFIAISWWEQVTFNEKMMIMSAFVQKSTHLIGSL
jgi:hypothetical protein